MHICVPGLGPTALIMGALLARDLGNSLDKHGAWQRRGGCGDVSDLGSKYSVLGILSEIARSQSIVEAQKAMERALNA